ncbi:hypothetical protein M5K25_004726 [Dendrobium thyrsiflorum]|uniref:Uncharacterized protein n=1 Tax=Dendrobium thyrsiflorum TaxID=117978 RepID=A0ABD0VH37_DENTH
MENVRLEGDSEPKDEPLDVIMAHSEKEGPSNEFELDEIAQVQLRSGKRLSAMSKKGVSDKHKGKEIV